MLKEIHAFTGYGTVKAEGKTHTWTVSGPNVVKVLRQVEPFMRVRRDHVTALLEFPFVSRGDEVTPGIARKRLEIYERLQYLNR